MTGRPKRYARGKRILRNPHVDRLIADINAQFERNRNLLVELGLADPETGEMVSSAEIDKLVAQARRRVEDRRGGGAE